MEQLSTIADAIAAGAASSFQETAKQVVVDLYAGLKALVLRRYKTVEPDVAGVESEPDEPLRRQLLAKQLAKAGAGEDEELYAAAQELLARIAELDPQAAETVGVRLTRVAVGEDIEISDIDVENGSGVTATDVSAGGSVKITRVKAGTSEPPHPSQTQGPLGEPVASPSITAARVSVGGDYTNTINNYSAAPNAGNTGRVRAITTSVVPNPLGGNLWNIAVHNGSNGPITDLAVEVYTVDDAENRTTDRCEPAKSQQTVDQFMETAMPMLRGGIRPILGQAGMLSGGLPAGALEGMFAGYANTTVMPGLRSQLQAHIQAYMTDSFPTVLTAGKTAEMLYAIEGTGTVQATITFADEDGNEWIRVNNQPPQPRG